MLQHLVTSNSRPGALVLGLCLALSLPLAGAAFAQAVDQNLWIPDRVVTCMARSGNTLYIGGNFFRLGPATGSGVTIDATFGVLVGGFPKVVGYLLAVVPDGSGGWYIGGTFSSVGGLARQNLAHILSNNTVSSWNPGADGNVHALAVSGATVYVGGEFTNAGGQARSRIAALDATTGLATAWNPNADDRVSVLTVSGATVYAGGWFTNIGGTARGYLAALDATTGLATAWNPNANFRVSGIGLIGSTVYVSGGFSTIGGQTRWRLAALDATTGLANAWNPNPDVDVNCLAISGSTVYVGGQFGSIGGQSRLRVAALDATTGLATSWNPGVDGTVETLATNGTTVYVGGTFFNVGGQARNYLAAVDAATGLATAWNPNPGSSVQAVALSGNTLYAGGYFKFMGGVDRGRFAALDLTTGLPTAWNPNAPPGVAYCLTVSGTTVYAGGEFTSIGGQSRNHIAALDATTGLATAWNPNCNGIPLALQVVGNKVYVAGSFTNIGGQSRSNLAALSTTTGLATSWNPSVTGGDAYAMVVSGNTAYVSGYFSSAGGQARNRIAALDLTTGLATTWNPNPDGGAVVNALAVDGQTVYAAGSFVSIGGQSRSNIAALDATTGLATAWNPGADGEIQALAVNGTTVYAGGSFSSAGGQARSKIAALDGVTGLARAWNPNATALTRTLIANGATVYAGGDFIGIGNLPQGGLASITASPALGGVVPARGGNLGPVTLSVTGSGLPSGTTLELARSGQSDIPGTGVVVRADALGLDATFDLTGAATGLWDVVVTTPDLQTATLTSGFTIEASAPHQLRVDVVGRSSMRPDRRRAFDLVIENLGNNDVSAVPLWIARIPATATVDLDFTLTPAPQSGGEPDWSTVPLTLSGPGGKYLALVIPRLPPGVTTRRFYLTVPNSVTSLRLDAALTPPWVDGNPLRSCLSGAGVISAPACMGAQLTAINATLATTPGIQALSGIGLWAKIAWQCEGAASLPAALVKAEQVLDFMLQPIEGAAVPAGCAVALTPRWQDSLGVKVVTSVDPNEKLGAGGVGPARLIGSQQLLPYSIQFENQQTATAPAQEVLVIDALDGAKLDLNTVSLGVIKFGKRASGLPWTIEPPPGSSSYTTDVDLRPEINLMVRVGFSLDRVTGQTAWSMISLDPATGQSPEDPMAGFLPPNLTAPQGEGSVTLTVSPKAGLANGTLISNQASINFDGTPLGTPPWSNTIDTGAPQSNVQPLGGTQDSASFTVRWALTGAFPDFRDYSVYVSQNGGPYRPWRLHTRATADTIGATRGGNYAFYSLARDSSGNLEAVPGAPDAQTYSRVAVGEAGSLALALEGAVPNPAIGEARVWFTLPGREPAALEVMDVAGRRVLRREVSAMGPGRHSVDVSGSVRRPGLYFLRLVQGGRTLRARMAVIR